MRRVSGVFFILSLFLFVACTGSVTLPTTGTTTASTTGTTTGSTTPVTTAPVTTPPTTPPITGGSTTGGATTGPDLAAACQSLDALNAAMVGAIPDFDAIKAAANDVLAVADDLSASAPQFAALLGTIGQDANDSAQAFLDGDFEKGANLQNRVLQTIPPAKVAMNCQLNQPSG
jgi:hypothetical protein